MLGPELDVGRIFFDILIKLGRAGIIVKIRYKADFEFLLHLTVINRNASYHITIKIDNINDKKNYEAGK